MAAFKIHEDLESLQRNVFKIIKHVEISHTNNENIALSQTNNENIAPKVILPSKRTVLKPVEKAEVKHVETKKLKLNCAVVATSHAEMPIAVNENQDPNITLSVFNTERIQQICDEDFLNKPEEDKQFFHVLLAHNYEYRKEIFKYLKEQELLSPSPRPTFMLKQTDLSWNTRSILIDWLASVCDEYEFSDQSFHLGVNYIDRVLSQIYVKRSKLQLVGASAMFVATKVEEIYPIDAKEWSYLTGDAFTKRQVLKMEQLIIKLLSFKIQPPTIYTFIEQLSAEHKMDNITLHLAKYVSELVLLEGDQYLNYLPSELAAGCIALARYLLSKHKPWPKKLKETSGYTLKQLSPVVQKQHNTFINSPTKELQAIQKKYQSPKYNKVALLKPRALNLKEFEDGA